MSPNHKAKTTKAYIWQVFGYTLIIAAVFSPFPSTIICLSFAYPFFYLNLNLGLFVLYIILVFHLFMIGAVAIIKLGKACVQHGRRLAIITAEELLKRDPRPPVLYLRSFVHDSEMSQIPARGLWHGGFRNSFYPLFFFLALPDHLAVKNEEEVLMGAFARIGPCVAVGAPNDQSPPAGMPRMYFPDDEWREAVLDYIRKAKLVVMRASIGTNDNVGFWEEMRLVVQHVDRRKLVILLGFEPRDIHYELFCKNAEKILGHKLPFFRGESLPRASLIGMIWFNSDFSPQVKPFYELGNTIGAALNKAFRNYRS